jgi:hypothetical protein
VAADCCSLGCNNGVCGGQLCATAGSLCIGDGACCSGQCVAGHCALGPLACLPTGEACGDDATVRCCSGFCNDRTDRCDLGPGACRETSAPCNPGECCRGQCERNAQGVEVCTAPCLAEGLDCNSDGDCCEGVCAGYPARCEVPLPICP